MRSIRSLRTEDDDPLQGVANLFDLGIVFGLGFMLALISYLGMPQLLQKSNVTVIKNPGTEEMEILHKKEGKLEHFRATPNSSGGEGIKLGTAYRLKSGEVVYVPE